MKKELAARIRAMKAGDTFTVKTNTERITASKAAKTLKQAGVIEFRLVTFWEGEGFKLVAV